MLVLLITFLGKLNSWAALCVVAASLSVWFWFLHAIPASLLSFILTGTRQNPQWQPHSLAMPLIHPLVLFLETGRCFWDHPDLLWAEQDLSSSSQEPPDHPGGGWIPHPAVQAHQGGWPAERSAADQSQVKEEIGLWRFAQTLEWFCTSWKRWKINHEPPRLNLISICKLLLVVWLRYLDSNGAHLWLLFLPENLIPDCQHTSIKQVTCNTTLLVFSC